MTDTPEMNEEIKKMEKELNEFKKEKEKVRAIIGRIGGLPGAGQKIVNILFIIVVFGTLITSLLVSDVMRYAMIDIAVALISLKIIYLIQNLEKVNHFELWTIASMEWQINAIRKDVKSIKKIIEAKENKK